MLDVGARPVQIDPVRHDAMVAQTSHLPQILSSALSLYLNGGADSELKGSGFRGMVRLAHSDERLWSEILRYNADNLTADIIGFQEVLGALLERLAGGDIAGTETMLRQAREAVA